MSASSSFQTPLESDLGLLRLRNASGLDVAVLPNGCLFAIRDFAAEPEILVNQMFGSPLGGGIGRLLLRGRVGDGAAFACEAMGPAANVALAFGEGRFAWRGESFGIAHTLTLWLHPREPLWLWHLAVENLSGADASVDAILIQDLGLGEAAFVTLNEAFASHYIDHHIARHPAFGPVLMSRQNLKQEGRNPWVAHGCLEGAKSFATDAAQVFTPAYRGASAIDLPFGRDLPGRRLQQESACAALQTHPAHLRPLQSATWTFFACYDRDHAQVSGNGDLAKVEAALAAAKEYASRHVPPAPTVRSIVQDAPALACAPMAPPHEVRLHEERRDGELLSYFTPDGAFNRHVVLGRKELAMNRRHGSILRGGQSILPADDILCATCWMHGVFAAQLTIGNPAFHKLFSVSRDPFNILRASGLRMLVHLDSAWWLLSVPSAFEMGLGDCRWIYAAAGRTITVSAFVSGEDAAMQWEVLVEGDPCAFVVFGQVVVGEKDFAHKSLVDIDAERRAITFRPDRNSLWGEKFPAAVYHLVTSSPEEFEDIGGDELLYTDGARRGGPYIALRTRATRGFRFAVVGSLTSQEEAARLAETYRRPVPAASLHHSGHALWERLLGDDRASWAAAANPAAQAILPWMAHDAVIHLSVPHGLEQYTGAAWGTRDVCQGPVEALIALGHPGEVRAILRQVFAKQFVHGDWPQWFMLEPYSFIEDQKSHGDVIIWPLKAVCDFVEATGDVSILSEKVGWHPNGGENLPEAPIAEHIETLLAELRARFIPGTHLPRYGEGDWNDTLQPADPYLKDHMVSSWTAGLYFGQLKRYAGVLRRAGRAGEAESLVALAEAVREDFNRHLIVDGTVAGYAIFDAGGRPTEYLLHPRDTKTGVKYSLIPMTCGILSGLFTTEQARHHLALIKEHLSFPDGVRLMDRPITYRGGAETLFRRAETAAYFGREIGLMYVHAHLRYCQALVLMGQKEAARAALELANPITVNGLVKQAGLRQRNCWTSSSEPSFADRYEATADWNKVKAGAITFEGGWRVYSSGPGLYLNILRKSLGRD